MAVIDLLVFGPPLRTLDALEGELAAEHAAGVADAWRSDDGRGTVLNPALRDAAACAPTARRAGVAPGRH